jgi:hypothetical protein
MSLTRRLLLTAAVAAPLAYVAARRPARNGGAHDAYFAAVQAALMRAGLYRRKRWRSTTTSAGSTRTCRRT